jgi:hypothetical protein
VAVAVQLAVVIALVAWLCWSARSPYGVVGGWRWRHGGRARYQVAWQQRQPERQALAALTPADRDWLREMGWQR